MAAKKKKEAKITGRLVHEWVGTNGSGWRVLHYKLEDGTPVFGLIMNGELVITLGHKSAANMCAALTVMLSDDECRQAERDFIDGVNRRRPEGVPPLSLDGEAAPAAGEAV